MQFKQKQHFEKFERMYDTAQRLKVEISSELNDLKQWINVHE